MTDLTRPEILLGLGLGILAGAFLSWVYFLVWRSRYLKKVRQDSVRQSQAVISGKVYEQLLPYLPEFPFNPKDVRFLGSPVDLVVFDGLDEGGTQAGGVRGSEDGAGRADSARAAAERGG